MSAVSTTSLASILASLFSANFLSAGSSPLASYMMASSATGIFQGYLFRQRLLLAPLSSIQLHLSPASSTCSSAVLQWRGSPAARSSSNPFLQRHILSEGQSSGGAFLQRCISPQRFHLVTMSSRSPCSSSTVLQWHHPRVAPSFGDEVVRQCSLQGLWSSSTAVLWRCCPPAPPSSRSTIQQRCHALVRLCSDDAILRLWCPPALTSLSAAVLQHCPTVARPYYGSSVLRWCFTTWPL